MGVMNCSTAWLALHSMEGGIQLTTGLANEADQLTAELSAWLQDWDLQSAVQTLTLPLEGGQVALICNLRPEFRQACMPGHDTLSLHEKLVSGHRADESWTLEREIWVALLGSPHRFQFASLAALGSHIRVRRNMALAGVLRNPMPWAISLGAAFSFWNLELIGPVNKTVSLLADAASPVALFTIGAVLARSQMLAHERPHGALRMVDYLPISLIKLVLHPVLVLLVGLSAIQWGLPIEPFALQVMVLVAALPSASNVSLLAERLGADNGRIARIILVTTAVAFLTFSGAVAFFKN